MVKRKVSLEVEKSIKNYIEVISQYYNIDAVYLFGSHAKGTPHKDSDIDIAIISKDIKDRIDDMGKLFALTWGIDTRIEPYPINTYDFQKQDTIMANEIFKTGIKIA